MNFKTLFTSISILCIAVLYVNCGNFESTNFLSSEQGVFSKSIGQENEITIALLGDTDIGDDFIEGLELTKRENPEIIMINGDFAYNNSGTTTKEEVKIWDEELRRTINFDKYSVLGSIGNHDIDQDDIRSHSGDILHRHVNNFFSYRNSSNQLKQKCTGGTDLSGTSDTVLLNEVCTFGNLSVIMSGVGVTEKVSKTYYENQLEQKLKKLPDNQWKLIGYHYTLTSMNRSGKIRDQNTHRFFDLIRQYGGIGVQAHTHAAMASCPIAVPFKEGDPVRCKPDFKNNVDDRKISPGTGIYLDSSVSGRDVRPYTACKNEGSSNCEHLYNYISSDGHHEGGNAPQNIGSRDGVIFITFNKGGDPSKAYVYFKNYDGNTIFDFTITRENINGIITPEPVTPPIVTQPPVQSAPVPVASDLSDVTTRHYRKELSGRVLYKVNNNLACKPKSPYSTTIDIVIYNRLNALYDKEKCAELEANEEPTPKPITPPVVTAPVVTPPTQPTPTPPPVQAILIPVASDLSDVNTSHYRGESNGRVLYKENNNLACKPISPFSTTVDRGIYDRLNALYDREKCKELQATRQTATNPVLNSPQDASIGLPGETYKQYRLQRDGRVLMKVNDNLACKPKVPNDIDTNPEIYNLLSEKYDKEKCEELSKTNSKVN